jgi:hypothetical protein
MDRGTDCFIVYKNDDKEINTYLAHAPVYHDFQKIPKLSVMGKHPLQ